MKEEMEIPEGWAETTLGEIAKKEGLKVNPSDKPKAKFIGMDCIQPNSMRVSFYYSFGEFKSSGNWFEKNHVLYGRMRPYLNKVFKATYEGACSGEFIVLNGQGNFNPDYLAYLLHHRDFVRFANSKTSGDRPRISFEEISSYPILLPPLPEQHRIVSKIEELFSSLDKGIDSLKTAKAQLKVYRQAVLKWAFEGKLSRLNRDSSDFYDKHDVGPQASKNHENQNHQKNHSSDNGELPEGWEWKKIGDVAESLDHKRKPINKDERAKRKGNIPYYGANGRTGWIDDYLFDEPLILVVEDETFVGREQPFSYKITGKSWVNNHAHILKPKAGLHIDFLNYQLYYYPFLPLTTGTTGRKKLTKYALINAPIKVCSLKEQHHIVSEIESRLSVCDKIEESINVSLLQAEALRQSILKKAFEGKLMPQDPMDEPAGVLLERVRGERERVGKGKSVGRTAGRKPLTPKGEPTDARL